MTRRSALASAACDNKVAPVSPALDVRRKVASIAWRLRCRLTALPAMSYTGLPSILTSSTRSALSRRGMASPRARAAGALPSQAHEDTAEMGSARLDIGYEQHRSAGFLHDRVNQSGAFYRLVRACLIHDDQIETSRHLIEAAEPPSPTLSSQSDVTSTPSPRASDLICSTALFVASS